MELSRLGYFLAVARHASVTRAARELRVAQPAVSQQIKALEREMCVSLFERTGHGMLLTEAGEVLFSYAEGIDYLSSMAVKEIHELTRRTAGEPIVIGAIASLANSIVPELIVGLKQLYPEVSLVIREDTTDRLLESLRDHTVTVVICQMGPETDRRGMEMYHLFGEELVAAVPRSHALFHKRLVYLEDLANEQLISAPPDSGLRHILDEAQLTTNVVAETSSFAMMYKLVDESAGVAILPRATEAFMKPSHWRGALISLRPELYRQIYLVTNRSQYYSVHVMAVIKSITSHASEYVVARGSGSGGDSLTKRSNG